MFTKLVKRLVGSKPKAPDTVALAQELETAYSIVRQGDHQAAIVALRRYLEHDPTNVGALNDLGACLSEVGDEAAARQTFELAYSLDDSFMPAAVNYAKTLADRRRSDEALSFLRKAKLLDPDFPGVDIQYANVCHQLGQLGPSIQYQLSGWLRSFDNLRFANGYLFNGTYADIDEVQMAAEHAFWAATLAPLETPEPSIENTSLAQADRRAQTASPPPPRKLRIGYWSPDFRAHSVRFFLRPLIEHHDRSRFEVFAYHDFPIKDEQTRLIEARVDQFHDIYALTNGEVCALIDSHRIDILVELAGHSSHNRLSLFQRRFAPLQVSALGYPPTTGLSTIDAKLIDRHVSTADDERCYAERALVLDDSFWCFDPMEEVPMPGPPPVLREGFVTFGCVGNIAKISDRVVACWRRILDRVAGSRLLLRSLNFEDPVAESKALERLVAAGIDRNRILCRKPAGGVEFFTSYDEIDVILDTYPFNGGTTSCFATYMGVPLITWAGKSLISRMGLSILSNLGAPQWVASDEHSYVDKAVALAGDIEAMTLFRRSARARFQASPLGNGRLFAEAFERACEARLIEMRDGLPPHRHRIPALPAAELMRRAYVAFAHNPPDAAKRIVAHCLEHHPHAPDAQLLLAQIKAIEHGPEAAVDHLESHLSVAAHAERAAILLSLARYALLQDQLPRSAQYLEALSEVPLTDRFDHLQAALLRACTRAPAASPRPLEGLAPTSVLVLIPCDSADWFVAMRAQLIATLWVPPDWRVEYQRCAEAQRVDAYAKAASRSDIDTVVIIQKYISVHQAQFLVEAQRGLEHADVLGFAGATCRTMLDWNREGFSSKAAGYIVQSSERAGFVELQILGSEATALVDGLVVLEGGLLVIDRRRWPAAPWDEELLGAESLMESDWTHAAALAGARLAAHRSLGIVVDQSAQWDLKQRAAGREYLARKLNFDPFRTTEQDRLVLSAPIASVERAVDAMGQFFDLIAADAQDPELARAPETGTAQENAGPPQVFLPPAGSGLGATRHWGRS